MSLSEQYYTVILEHKQTWNSQFMPFDFLSRIVIFYFTVIVDTIAVYSTVYVVFHCTLPLKPFYIETRHRIFLVLAFPLQYMLVLWKWKTHPNTNYFVCSVTCVELILYRAHVGIALSALLLSASTSALTVSKLNSH